MQPQLHIATPHTPDRPDASTVAFQIGAPIQHLEESGNKRTFEGWASLSGVDWQDEDVPPSVFEDALRVYMAKNPVVLWDHKRDHPIGRILHAHVDEKGLFIQGEVLQDHHYGDPASELAQKANEVWSLMQQRIVKGLSWAGRARKRNVWSEQLQRNIKQPIELLLHEITITPIQVHPGAQITGVNTLAKALEIAKALPLGTSTTNTGECAMSKFAQIQELQQKLVAELQALPDDVEIPAKLLETQEAVSKALGMGGEEAPDPVAPVVDEGQAIIDEAVAKALAPFADQLEKLGMDPAPLRNRVSHAPSTGSQPKPGEEMSGAEITEKALSIGRTSIRGVGNFGNGDTHGATPLDTLKVWMLANENVIQCAAKGLGRPAEMTPTPGMIALGRAALQ